MRKRGQATRPGLPAPGNKPASSDTLKEVKFCLQLELRKLLLAWYIVSRHRRWDVTYRNNGLLFLTSCCFIHWRSPSRPRMHAWNWAHSHGMTGPAARPVEAACPRVKRWPTTCAACPATAGTAWVRTAVLCAKCAVRKRPIAGSATRTPRRATSHRAWDTITRSMLMKSCTRARGAAMRTVQAAGSNSTTWPPLKTK